MPTHTITATAGSASATVAVPVTVGATAGWPDASSTGPSGSLVPSGSIEVTTPGTVIENLDILGNVMIRAHNVTVRNCRITTNAPFGGKGAKYLIDIGTDGYSGIIIEDCELDGRNASTQGVVHSGYIARRCNVHHLEDGFRASGDCVIEDCYIHDLAVTGTGWSAAPHNDGIQSIGGNGITIRHNRIEGPYREQTSALILHAHLAGPLTNLLVEDNLLSGGTYTVSLKARTGQPDLGPDVVFRNNVVVAGTWKFGSFQSDRAAACVFEGNTLDDGTPIW